MKKNKEISDWLIIFEYEYQCHWQHDYVLRVILKKYIQEKFNYDGTNFISL